LPGGELERRRAESRLGEFVPRLASALSSVTDAGQLIVVADADGRVLWRLGSSGVRRMADSLGFVGGSAWTEGNVGTNAIGTSLVLGEGVQIQGPEHFVQSHTRWGCAAAPLKDPWSGRTLGVVDVSGPSRGMHPAELALVEMAARVTALEILDRRRTELHRLRSRAAPLLAPLTGDVLAVDSEGHLAAGVGSRLPDRVRCRPA
jgi:transcriptional regulator of acetoin/glycerol metabolism